LETAALYGSAGSATVLVTWPVARSIAETVCANTRVTYNVLPSGATATPPAKLWPATAGSANDRARVITPLA
jgi:hypothetical protein